MKKITIVAVLFPLIALAQRDIPEIVFPEVNGKINYTEVINLDSTVKKDELYNRAKTWFAENYNSANDVIQMQDKEAGILIGRGVYSYGYNPASLSDRITINISYVVKIFVKDGKYKYEITDLSGRYYSGGGYSNLIIKNGGIGRNERNYYKLCESIHESIVHTRESLTTSMQEPVISNDF